MLDDADKARIQAILIAFCGIVDAAESLFGPVGHVVLGIALSDGMMLAVCAAIGWFLLREPSPVAISCSPADWAAASVAEHP